jgi:hypothetical protein
VVLRGFMNGCCANCRYDEYQNRCKYEYGKSEYLQDYDCTY